MPALLERSTERFGRRDYLITSGRTLTFRDVDRESRRIAKCLLRSGIGKGTRVGIFFPQGPEFVTALLAVTRIGGLAVPISTFQRGPELRRLVCDADLHTLLAPRSMFGTNIEEFFEATWTGLATSDEQLLFLEEAPHLRHIWLLGGGDRSWVTPLADSPQREDETGISDALLRKVESTVAPSDLLVMIHTSGATAGPKAVVHSHGGLIRHAASLAQLYGLTEEARTFTTMPFFWVGGLTVTLMSHLHVGAAVITVERVEGGAMLDVIETTRPTRLVGWTLLERLRADPTFASRDLSWLPELADPTPTDPRSRHGSLGMTETGGPHTAVPSSENRSDLPDHLQGSFGRPMPGMEHKIVDPATGLRVPDDTEGEICVRGYSLMEGLYRRERAETFDSDGWYHTRDKGYFRDGFLFFTGRLSDMIKTRGANVSPREVELALEDLDGVRAAFVVGIPDEQQGEVVGCVLCAEPDQHLDPTSLLDQLARRLSSYKVPRKVRIVPYDDLPWLPSGKMNKPGIVELLTD